MSIVDTKPLHAASEEGDKFVAYSPAIDLSTCGDTEEQARKRFIEAASLFFDEIISMGTVVNLKLKPTSKFWEEDLAQYILYQ